MKQKELEKLAKKFVKQQRIIDSKNHSEEEKRKAENEIERLAGKIKSLDDMVQLDEMIQDLLLKSF